MKFTSAQHHQMKLGAQCASRPLSTAPVSGPGAQAEGLFLQGVRHSVLAIHNHGIF